MPRPDGVRVFLDSSVLVAATLSSSGGSFRLCRESHVGHLRLLTNRYVRDEVTRVLGQKYPSTIPRFRLLLKWARVKILSHPPAKVVDRYLWLINVEDAPILSGAIIASADVLVTLDRKDFMSERLRRARLPLTILTPQEFFQQYWR